MLIPDGRWKTSGSLVNQWEWGENLPGPMTIRHQVVQVSTFTDIICGVDIPTICLRPITVQRMLSTVQDSRILNCGFRPGLTAGTDYPFNEREAIGTLLTYVYIPDRILTYQKWIEGIAKGNTVVSRVGHNEFLDLII